MKNFIEIKRFIKSEFLNYFKSDKKEVIQIDLESYTESFSYQWKNFPETQIDSKNKDKLSMDRFKHTGWTKGELKGKSVLEVGSGAGRFTEILMDSNPILFTIDSSEAIYVNFDNNKKHKNIENSFFIKNSVEKDIFKDNSFDYVFCYGVVQHTKNLFQTLDYLIEKLNHNGILSVDFYRKWFIPMCWNHPKYLWRPVTTRMKKETLMKIIDFYIPIYLPIDTFIKKLFGKFGLVICGLIPIPCWNYYSMVDDKKKNLELAKLDTFDALSAKYDYPVTKRRIHSYMKKYYNCEYELKYGSNGIVMNLKKKLK